MACVCLWTELLYNFFELAFFEMLVQRSGCLLNGSGGIGGVAVQHIDLPYSAGTSSKQFHQNQTINEFVAELFLKRT